MKLTIFGLAMAAIIAMGATAALAAPAPKVTICHATGSESNPYVPVTIAAQAWENGHSPHAVHIGDFLMTTGRPCGLTSTPTPTATPTATLTATPTPAPTVAPTLIPPASVTPIPVSGPLTTPAQADATPTPTIDTGTHTTPDLEPTPSFPTAFPTTGGPPTK